MIVTRTPLRVTLGGGGTDLPSYYTRHGGFVFAMGIDKFMYIMLNSPIVDRKVRLHYSRSETVDRVDELQHELAREALRLHGVEDGIEISSMADLPEGTGLGSSGAYLVGVLTALHHHLRDYVPLQTVAEEACTIEMDVLGKSIGKQDQYMATYGGLTVLDIDRSGTVTPRRLELSASIAEGFIANTHLYYTGVRRSAAEVLQHQHDAMNGSGPTSAAGAKAAPPRAQVEDSLHRIKELGQRILETITAGDLDGWGQLLHEHWCQKKRLSPRVSLDEVDALYEYVREEFGVLGGKLAGAGGGGFLMLYAPGRHEQLEAFMASRGLVRLRYGVAPDGSRVVLNTDRAPVAAQARALV